MQIIPFERASSLGSIKTNIFFNDDSFFSFVNFAFLNFLLLQGPLWMAQTQVPMAKD